MNLTFEKGYDDYTDSVGWRKVYEEARRFSARLTRESAGGMDDEELLSAMEQLEELIRTHCPTMVFVEHDRTFAECVATKAVELTGGGSR